MKKELMFFIILVIGILLILLVSLFLNEDSSKSYIMRATNFKTDMGVDKVTFQYKENAVWTDVMNDVKEGDVFQLENLEFETGPISKEESTVKINVNSWGLLDKTSELIFDKDIDDYFIVSYLE